MTLSKKICFQRDFEFFRKKNIYKEKNVKTKSKSKIS